MHNFDVLAHIITAAFSRESSGCFKVIPPLNNDPVDTDWISICVSSVNYNCPFSESKCPYLRVK